MVRPYRILNSVNAVITSKVRKTAMFVLLMKNRKMVLLHLANYTNFYENKSFKAQCHDSCN